MPASMWRQSTDLGKLMAVSSLAATPPEATTPPPLRSNEAGLTGRRRGALGPAEVQTSFCIVDKLSSVTSGRAAKTSVPELADVKSTLRALANATNFGLERCGLRTRLTAGFEPALLAQKQPLSKLPPTLRCHQPTEVVSQWHSYKSPFGSNSMASERRPLYSAMSVQVSPCKGLRIAAANGLKKKCANNDKLPAIFTSKPSSKTIVHAPSLPLPSKARSRRGPSSTMSSVSVSREVLLVLDGTSAEALIFTASITLLGMWCPQAGIVAWSPAFEGTGGPMCTSHSPATS
mmetsp:Transcript_115951/g.368760  ORF Transcript_115951/g.368760 Transcript_115951/m.368760 type:complete len:290 (+) Transcript_115951:1188-2057(+)